MKKIIEKFLKISAGMVLKQQKPEIIVVTGSVGKTQSKEAIYNVLAGKFICRRNIKNYNNELGVPLTILGELSPGKFFFGWLKVFLKAVPLIILKKKNYPQILILEIAADKPADLKYIMEIFPRGLLRVAVLTAVAPVHIEFFGTIENIFKEKIIPFSYLAEDNFAVVNKDNCPLEKIKSKVPSQLISYGLFGEVADVSAEKIKIDKKGLEFKFRYKEDSFPFLLKEGISAYQIYPLLAGVSVGLCYRMDLREISQRLSQYKALAGRMRKIEGKKGSLILDDTYNSSPEALKRALETLANLPFGKRKIAVLGDMLELGKFSENFHREIGKLVASLQIDYLITLGEEAEFIFEEAIKKGLSQNNVFKFKDLKELSDFLKKFLMREDVLLIKGSQGMRMEKIVKEIMANPEKAKSLLVRQDEEWL